MTSQRGRSLGLATAGYLQDFHLTRVGQGQHAAEGWALNLVLHHDGGLRYSTRTGQGRGPMQMLRHILFGPGCL